MLVAAAACGLMAPGLRARSATRSRLADGTGTVRMQEEFDLDAVREAMARAAEQAEAEAASSRQLELAERWKELAARLPTTDAAPAPSIVLYRDTNGWCPVSRDLSFVPAGPTPGQGTHVRLWSRSSANASGSSCS